jgi:hypothetical protein
MSLPHRFAVNSYPQESTPNELKVGIPDQKVQLSTELKTRLVGACSLLLKLVIHDIGNFGEPDDIAEYFDYEARWLSVFGELAGNASRLHRLELMVSINYVHLCTVAVLPNLRRLDLYRTVGCPDGAVLMPANASRDMEHLYLYDSARPGLLPKVLKVCSSPHAQRLTMSLHEHINADVRHMRTILLATGSHHNLQELVLLSGKRFPSPKNRTSSDLYILFKNMYSFDQELKVLACGAFEQARSSGFIHYLLFFAYFQSWRHSSLAETCIGVSKGRELKHRSSNLSTSSLHAFPHPATRSRVIEPSCPASVQANLTSGSRQTRTLEFDIWLDRQRESLTYNDLGVMHDCCPSPRHPHHTSSASSTPTTTHPPSTSMLSSVLFLTVLVFTVLGSAIDPRAVYDKSRERYTHAHSLGADYSFDPRDGWTSLNVTDMQYKYSRSHASHGSRNFDGAAAHRPHPGRLPPQRLPHRTRSVTHGVLFGDKLFGESTESDATASDSVTHSSTSAKSGSAGGALDALSDVFKTVGSAEDVLITWYAATIVHGTSLTTD